MPWPPFVGSHTHLLWYRWFSYTLASRTTNLGCTRDTRDAPIPCYRALPCPATLTTESSQAMLPGPAWVGAPTCDPQQWPLAAPAQRQKDKAPPCPLQFLLHHPAGGLSGVHQGATSHESRHTSPSHGCAAPGCSSPKAKWSVGPAKSSVGSMATSEEAQGNTKGMMQVLLVIWHKCRHTTRGQHIAHRSGYSINHMCVHSITSICGARVTLICWARVRAHAEHLQ